MEAAATRTDGSRVFFCYWGSWSHYRDGAGKFSVGQIDASLCTHLVYAFAKLDNGVIAAFDPYLDLKDNYGLGMYEKVNKLKTTHPQLKTLLAIGGWNEGSEKYSRMASTPEGRKRFAQSVSVFLSKYGFDGLDLDWEYPAARGGGSQDKQNFVLLLEELRSVLNPKGLLLTAAVSAGKATVDAAYDVPGIMRYLDYVSVMAYDFFGSWNSYTGHCSPLGAREHGSEEEKTLNVESSIRMWLDKGADRAKLVLGMPLYGRTFTLADPRNDGFLAPTVGPGPAGPITREAGYLGYNEICSQLQSSKDWKITRDPRVVAPVAVKGNLWIGYDDAQSLTAKVEFLRSLGLAGAMVWSIETDDFQGACGTTKNPLQRAIREALAGNATVTTTTLAPTTQSAGTSTTAALPSTVSTTTLVTSATTLTTTPQPVLTCTQEGFYAYPNNPRKFYRCVLRPDGSYATYVFDCAPGTVFNATLSTCTF
ncbi:chitinase-3-like protein 1 isoform X2 [Amblyomma americanum]